MCKFLRQESFWTRYAFSLAIAVAAPIIGCDRIRNAVTLSGYAIIGGKPSYVYTSTNHGREVTPLANADTSTFEVVEQGEQSRFRYAKDKNQVYIEKDIIPGAKPASFRVLSRDGTFSRDATRMYFRGAPIENADPDTFVILDSDFGKDATNAFVGTIMLPSVHIETWTALGKGRAEDPWYRSADLSHVKDPSSLSGSGWSRDKNFAYYGERLIRKLDADSLTILGDYYAKDKTSVFYGDSEVQGADAGTFVLLPGPHYANPDAKDANASYRYGKVVP
jgi:hypothetical protein